MQRSSPWTACAKLTGRLRSALSRTEMAIVSGMGSPGAAAWHAAQSDCRDA
jgi:hypothetical protein